jgi:serine/threonine protein kinase
VLDFGVAGPTEPPSASDGVAVSSRREVTRPQRALSPLPCVDLTDDDLVIGTPPFMAPEQLVGGKVDHRSDQFAFCVCLHEALYGRSPLVGRTYMERRRLMRRGQVLDEQVLLTGPRARSVPSRVRRALLRGLSVDPSTRHESMRALLVELEPIPHRRLARVGLTLLFGFAAGVSAMASLAPWAAEPVPTTACVRGLTDAIASPLGR